MQKFLQNYITKNWAWVLVVVGFFALVYLFSLTFVSIDGDHAAALTYHLVERNEDIQRPYFFYHGMMDVIVSFIPADYETMETMSLAITAVAAVLLVMAMLTLLFEWMKQLDISLEQRWLIALMVLLFSPEYFFFGLVYNPSAIAMLLMLIAHLLMRKVVADYHQAGDFTGTAWSMILIAAMAFGFGTAFRWNIGLYGAIIFLDAVILHMQLHKISFAPSNISKLITKPIFVYVGWGVLALVCALIAIRISGYDLADIQLQLENVENSYDSIGQSTVKNLLPFTTPGFGLMAGIGFLFLLRRKSPFILLILVGAVLVAPVFVSGVPKQLLPAIPAISLCAILGFHWLWYQVDSASLRNGLRLVLLLIVLAPWFIGLTIHDETAQFGPWFTPMSYDRDEIIDEGIGWHLGPGRAYNTPEGFRPLMGYGFVLFHDWRTFSEDQNTYYNTIVTTAIAEDLPIVVTQYPNAYEVNRLLGLGYRTDDYEYRPFEADDRFVERRFVNGAGDTVTVLYYEILADSDIDALHSLDNLLPQYDRLVWRGYMHTIRHSYFIEPNALETITPNAVILDLRLLSEALQN